ncbi:M56 family metallopeptidase [Verrucomicrobium sp. BvORR034]|uniref:M56 family metallopeptidase n=1 Tax=Verrucomicrobium sp. BvORR034 TaxID=1396418 RepID=UPI0006799D8B|nr:M56 family metallopeptidase [Verrucomicrobium sp. BvORR034]
MSLHFLHSPWLSQLGASLLHSLWQAAAVWLLLSAILVAMRKASAAARHCLVLAALTFTLLLPVGTMVWLGRDLKEAAEVSRPSAGVIASLPSPISDHIPAISPRPESVPIVPRPLPKPEPAPLAWQALVAVIWATGVMFLCLRLTAGWWLMHRLRHDASRCTAPWVPGLLERTALPAARVLCSARLQVPMVVGWFRPVIYLPAAIFGRMTLAAAETVVLHELAHLRRQDPLINLWITTVETLLFFNPPVRAMARTARDEAECACDDQVLAWGGDRPTYARALADLEAVRPEHLPLTLAATGGSGLLQRIQRILGTVPPQGRPFVSQTIGLATLASITGVILVCALAVPPLARAFTPEERIAALAVVEEAQTVDPMIEWKAVGNLVDEDGKVITVDQVFTISSWSERRSFTASERNAARFTCEGFGKSMIVGLWLEGHAPASTIVQAPKNADEPTAFSLVVRKGYPAKLKLVDETGAAISGAELHVKSVMLNGEKPYRQGSLQTSASGEATIGNAETDSTFEIEVRAYGHEWSQFEGVRFANGVPTTISVLKIEPLDLPIVDANTGAAVPGARAYCCSWEKANESMSYGSRSFLASMSSQPSGNDGHLKLDLWSPNRNFLALIEAPGYATAISPVVPRRPLEPVRLFPELKLGGVIHDPEKLLSRSGKSPMVRYYLDSDSGNSWKLANFNMDFETEGRVQGTEVHFSIGQLNPGEIEFNCNGREWKTRVTDSKSDLQLYLSKNGLTTEGPDQAPPAPPQERTVRFRLHPPPDQPPAQGNFVVRVRGTERPLPIKNGEATGRFQVGDSIDFLRHGIAGYTRQESLKEIKLTNGEGDVELDIHLIPSGGITGQLVSAAAGLDYRRIMGTILRLNDEGTRAMSLEHDIRLPSGSDKYVVTGLPLHANYRILFRSGHRLVESPWVKLDESNPLPETPLTLPKGQTISGKVFEADGTPASQASLTLVYHLREWSYWYTTFACAQDGSFTLEGMNFDVEGSYSLHINNPDGKKVGSIPISSSDHSVVVKRL